MKKYLLVILASALFTPTTISAQEYEYVPFVREGVEWGYEEYKTPPYRHFFHYRIEGDTLINGVSYNKCYRYNTCDEKTPILKGWIREQDKKVYMLANIKEWEDEQYFFESQTLENEVMLYDFSVEKPGDAIPSFEGGESFTVNRIDSVLINGKLRKRYFYRDDACIIEGIGTLLSCNLLRPFIPMPTSTFALHSNLSYVKSETGRYEFNDNKGIDYCAECEAVEGKVLLTAAKLWMFEIVNSESGETTGDFTVYAIGNQTVNDKYCRTLSALGGGKLPTYSSVYAYEEDRKAYCLNGDNEWTLVYDINLSKGDPVGGGFVVDEGIIEVDGSQRKWIEIDTGTAFGRYYVVEGIGANKLPFYGLGLWDSVGENEYYRMVECHENSTCVFTAEDFGKLSSGIEDVTIDSPVSNGKTYDIGGREVTAPQSGTIYIKEGKKFLKK